MVRWGFCVLLEQLIDLVFEFDELEPATHQCLTFLKSAILLRHFLQSEEPTLHLVRSVLEFVKQIVPWVVLADIE